MVSIYARGAIQPFIILVAYLVYLCVLVVRSLVLLNLLVFFIFFRLAFYFYVFLLEVLLISSIPPLSIFPLGWFQAFKIDLQPLQDQSDWVAIFLAHVFPFDSYVLCLSSLDDPISSSSILLKLIKEINLKELFIL